MTLDEKLQFMVDRIKDGKEFYLGDEIMKFDSERLTKHLHGEWLYSDIKFNVIDYYDIELKPQWEFTEDEKVILRNLPEQYKWIARDEISPALFVYTSKPTKEDQEWLCGVGNARNFNIFKHLFKSIKWSDEEPCEFRRYIYE